MRAGLARILFVAIVTLTACTVTLPAQPTQTPITTSYATVEAALRVLVEHQVDRPSSKLLLGGAVDEIITSLQKQGTAPTAAAPSFTGKTDEDLQSFSDYLDVILQKTAGLAKNQLERTAVDGMAKSTHECHTYYLDPDRAKNFNQPSREQYSGIGARIQQAAPNTSALPEITQVFPGSPAEKAGLEMGDRIKTVDDKDVSGLTADEVANLIKGPAGSSVRLVIQHAGGDKQLTITRATLVVPDIVESMQSGKYGYVGISNITANIPRDLQDAMGRLDQGGAVGWVLDLRSDPGGLLDPAEQVASTFIKNGNILYEVDRNGNAAPKPVNPKAFYPRQKPLAVLVNRYSASGAEIIASAIQEHGSGRVFGEATAGCISIALPRELPDGGLLLYTYARIQSGVRREDLSGKGVTPDEVVLRAPDEAGDKVLDAAVAWLRTQAQP
ncbi:MAG: hypothetical protein AUH85_14620 [Chloroflexi bacterium 13_1_40CM_4_68_4]|nr:MAG: hypothetical protein AUH85_14620 [Chloroflexi bacterium 13_1_40CM_4_68_4]